MKTQPKQLLGSLPLAFALPVLILVSSLQARKEFTWVEHTYTYFFDRLTRLLQSLYTGDNVCLSQTL